MPQNTEKGLADGIGTAADYVVIRSGIELDRFGHPAIWAVTKREPARGHSPRRAGCGHSHAPLGAEGAAGFRARRRSHCADTARCLVCDGGDGDLRPQVEALATELGICDRWR